MLFLLIMALTATCAGCDKLTYIFFSAMVGSIFTIVVGELSE